MSRTRSQLARWNRILQALRSGRQITAARLAEDCGVSLRTIQRDLDALRDDHGAQISYHAAERSLRLEGLGHRLLGIELSEADLLHLVVGAGMAGQFRGTPVADSLRRLFEKLQAVLDPPCDLGSAMDTDCVRFHEWPARPVREDVWMELLRCTRHCLVASILYRAAGYQDAVPLEVEPIYLSCDHGDWYLEARGGRRRERRTYALSRILQVRATGRSFVRRTEDDPAGDPPRFARFRSRSNPDRVRIRFTAEAAEWVRERVWHQDQTIAEHRDGGLTLTVPIDGDREAVAWILRWGPAGRVLSPAWLRREILAAVTEMKQALE